MVRRYFKKILLVLSLFFLPGLAWADNTEKVAAGGIMAVIFGTIFSFGFLWMTFVGLMMTINVLGIALWIWMLVDVAKRDFKEDNDKIIWILIVVLAGWIGALIYYFLIKRKDPSTQLRAGDQK